MLHEHRKFKRAHVGHGYTLRMRIAGRIFSQLAFHTLGGGGCCLTASGDVLQALREHIEVEELILEHPQLPQDPLRARVAYFVGNQPAEVGITFLDVPKLVTQALEAHVRDLLGSRPIPKRY